jgi:hypothetical protein
MNLIDVIGDLENTDDSMTICAARTPRWSEFSEVELCPSDAVRRAARLQYFLEVSVAKDVLRAWSFARNGQNPTLSEKCKALIYYAENDAYRWPEHERSE